MKRIRPTGVFKKTNDYAQEVAEIYARTPKAVFAALAVAFAHRTLGGDMESLAGVEQALLEEWKILHNAGIVPQAPPRGQYRSAV